MSPLHDWEFGVKELKEAQALYENVLRLRTIHSKRAQDPDLELRLAGELEVKYCKSVVLQFAWERRPLSDDKSLHFCKANAHQQTGLHHSPDGNFVEYYLCVP